MSKRSFLVTAVIVLILFSFNSFAQPAAIVGAGSVCSGRTLTLTDATSGGTWSSSNTAVATITTGGVVGGVASGMATISYTTSGGSATATVTVNATPVTASFAVSSSTICAGAATTFTRTPSGCSANAVSFATAGAVATGTLPTTGVDNITVEGWVKWSGANGISQIIFYNGNTGSNGYGLMVNAAAGNTLSVLCGGVATMNTLATLTVGIWHHVGIVRNAGTWTIYIDGVPNAVSSPTSTPATPTGNFLIGNNAAGGPQQFNGAIDEVLFWTAGRTTAQILTDRTNCNTAVQANLKGYWKLEEGTGATTADASGNSFTLALNAASWTPINTFTWTFGDGATSSADSVSHTYATAAAYTPTLTVSNAGCAVTTTGAVTVNPLPSAAFSTSATALCAGGFITFTTASSSCSGNALNFPASSSATRSIITTVVDNITVEGWVKWNGDNGASQLLFYNGNSGANGYGLIVDNASGNTLSILCGGVGYMNTSAVLTVGTWQHVAIVRSAGTWSLYVDNTPYALSAATTTPATPSGSFILGNGAIGSGQSFNGAIDEAKFWTIARNATQIQADRITCNTPAQTGLTGYWKLEEGTGTTAADASGNGNALALTGTSWTTATPILSTYAWAFGDGSTASLSSVAHAYTAAAIYSATLTVTNAYGCTALSSSVITVNAQPAVAGVTASAAPVCVGSTLVLTAGAVTGGGTIASYNWSGPSGYSTAGTTATKSISSVTAAKNGVYSLTVTYTSGCISPVVTTASVTVNAQPVVASITPSATSFCAGPLLTLTAGAVTGGGTISSYNWSGPNGYTATSTVATAIFIPATAAASGTYSLSVTYVGGCTSASVTTSSVTVLSQPAIAGVAASVAPVCAGSTLVLTAGAVTGGGTISSYNWIGPGGYSATGTSATQSIFSVSAAQNGVYSLTVTYAGGCTSVAVTTGSVTVNAQPTVAGITPSSTYLCFGTQVTLTAGAVAGGGVISSYNWSGPAGYSTTTVAGSAARMLTASNMEGTYSLSVTYSGGCISNKVTTSFGMFQPITIASVSVSATSLCGGTVLTLTAGSVSSPSYPISYYIWTGPNGYSTTGTPTSKTLTPTTVAASGIYSVAVRASNGCTSNVVQSPIVTVLAPVISVAANTCTGGTLTLTASVGAGMGTVTSYRWVGPNGLDSVTTAAQLIFTSVATAAGGTYSVYATGSTCPAIPAIATVVIDEPLSVIGGNLNVCIGTPQTLSNTIAGGIWSSSDATVATVATGVVTGISTGTSVISYSKTNACGIMTVSATVNVINGIAPITGGGIICVGTPVTVADATTGGTWSSGNTSIAVVSSTGAITGVADGTATISYTKTLACGTLSVIGSFVVSNGTLSTAIAGASTVCAGSSITMTNSTAAGLWSSSAPTIAGVSSVTGGTPSGSVMGISRGTAIISYTRGIGSCAASVTRSVTVNGISPSYSSNGITGGKVCSGDSLQLKSDTVAASSWSWSGPNGFTSTVRDPAIAGATTASSGIYTFTATTAGCTAGRSLLWVAVGTRPSVTVSQSAPYICPGAALSLIATALPASSADYNTYAIPYSLQTLSSAATVLPAGDDESYRISLPFTFNFYGTDRTSLFLNMNGSVSFEHALSSFVAPTLPITSTGYSLIGLGMSDVYTTALGIISYETIGNAPNRKFVVYYKGCASYASGGVIGNGTLTGQIILYETTNVVELMIGRCDLRSAAATSATDWTYTFGMQSSNESTYITPPGLNGTLDPVLVPQGWRFAHPGSYNYAWTPSATLSDTATSNPVSTGLTATQVFTLTTTDVNSSCTTGTKASDTAIVNAPVIAGLTTSSATICAGTNITLTAGVITAYGPATAYYWSGPGGYSATTTTPSVMLTPGSAASSGSYSVTATNGTGCMGVVQTRSVTVNAQPIVAGITPSTTLLCTGSALTLTAGAVTGGGAVQSYNWSGPNVYSATGTAGTATLTPSATAASGVYSLSVTYIGGCVSPVVSAAAVTVNARPILAGITPSVSTSCTGSPLTLTAGTTTGTGALTSYNWSGPGGYSTSGTAITAVRTPTNTTASGIYSLTATYPGTGCTSQPVTTASVTVNAQPTVASITSSATTLCTSSPLTLTAGTATGMGTLASYNWSGPGSYSASGIATTAVYIPTNTTASGIYSLTATYPGFGCTSLPVTTASVTVNARPVIASVSAYTTAICTGMPLTLTAGTTTGTGTFTSYNWSGPGGYSTSGTTVTAVYTPTNTTASGIYSLTATYPGAGCISLPVTTASVTVNAQPTVAGITPSATVLCTGSSLTLTAGTTTGTGTVSFYNWSGPGGYSASGTAVTAVYTPTNATASGIYSLIATYPGLGCTSLPVITASIIVNASPAPSFTLPDTSCGVPPLSFTDLALPSCRVYSIKTGSAATASAWALNAGSNQTIEAWVRWDGTTGSDQYIVSNGYSSIFGGYAMGLRASASDHICVYNGGMVTLVSSVGLTRGVWQHVAIVCNSGTWSVYLDGVQYAVTYPTTTPYGGSSDLYVGSNSTPATSYFNGAVSTVVTWALPRTTAQILADGASCSISPQIGLQGYWKFNEGTGTTVADASGNNNTLTLPANAWAPLASTYAWNFADGATSSLAATVHTYTSSGVFTPSLTLTNSAGCAVTYSRAVFIKPTPIINSITASATSLCTGSPLTITANAVAGGGTITSYNWSGPNGYSATTVAATLTPSTTAASGIYSLSLTSGSGCISSVATTPSVIVRASPAPVFTSPDTSCGVPISFSDLELPSCRIYSIKPGPTATASCLGALSYANYFTIEAWVKWDGTTGNDQYIVSNGYETSFGGVCMGLKVGESNHICVFNGGVVTHVSSAGLTPGVWQHVAIELNSGTWSVYLDGVQYAVTYPTTTPYGPSSSLYIGSNGTPATSYFNGSVSTVAIWSLARTTAQIVADAASCSISPQIGLRGYWKFDEGTGTTVADASGNNVALTMPATVWSPLSNTYAWNFTDGGTSSFPVTTHTYTSPGIFTPTLTVTNSAACAISYSRSIFIKPTPLISGITASATSLCAGSTLTLTAGTVTGTGTITYNWSGPNGYSAAAAGAVAAFTPSATAASGVYSLAVVGTSSCFNVATTPLITVKESPTPSFTIPDTSCIVPLVFNGQAAASPLCSSYSIKTGSASTISRTTVSSVTDNLTLEAWVKWTGTTGGNQHIIYNGDNSINGYGIVLTSSSSNHISVYCGGVAVLTSSAVLTPGMWQHVAIVRNAGTWSVYLDGAQYAVSGATTSPNAPSAVFNVGYNLVAPNTYFNGAIDNVVFWSSARTAAQILADRTACSISPQTGLEGYWKFDEGSGTITADASGNGRSLNMAGITWAPMPNSYAWTFGDAATSTLINVNHTYTSSGVFTPTLTVTNGIGCAVSYSRPINIKATPVITGVTASGACTGSALTLTAGLITGGGTIATYNWSGPAGYSATTTAAMATFIPTAIATGYVYSLTAAYTNGCSNVVPAITSPINISATPVVSPISGDTMACGGDVLNLADTASGGIWNSSDTTVASVMAGAIFAHGFGATTISYGITNSCGTATAMRTVILNPMLWTGNTSSDWNTTANWTCGRVPTVTDDIMIPVTATAPVLPALGSGFTRKLELAPGAAITLSAGAVMNVKGDLLYNGSMGEGKIYLSGAVTQKVRGIANINELEINNAAGVTIDSGSRIIISKTLSITSGTLATHDSLALASDVNGSGRVAELPATGAAIVGKVKVQQYIQSGYRRFRFWAHPFSAAVSLSQLQPYMDITGAGGAGNGFTTTGTNAPSAFRLDPYTENSTLGYDPGWKPITKINGTEADSNKLQPHQGLRLFMRGSKGEGLGGWAYAPSENTVAMTGPVNQGNQTVILHRGHGPIPTQQDYNMVGNPYPSPVDIGTAIYNSSLTGDVVGAAYYVYNASLGVAGQFQAIMIGTGAPDPYSIQTNACFQVRAGFDSAQLHFTESMKTQDATTYLLKPTAKQFVSLNVYDENYHPWDMLTIMFNDKATDAEDIKLDAVKPSGADFNFYSLSADNKKMVIDSRPYAVEKIIPLGVSSAYQQAFIIRADNVSIPENTMIYLHDKLLNRNVELNGGTEYKFNISKDKATQGNDRFELRLKPASAISLTTALKVTMSPNPTTDDVKISFTLPGKEYVSIRIMDITGLSVYSRALGVQQSGSVTIPLSQYSSGVYMVEVTVGDMKVVQRLVKE